MKTPRLYRPPIARLLLAALLLAPLAGYAQQQSQQHAATLQIASLIEDEKRPQAPLILPFREAPKSSWAFAFDNDILAPGHRDQDYTYGFNVTYTGARAKDAWLSLDRPLSGLDTLFKVNNVFGNGIDNHSMEVGLFGFTPEDITVAEANPDDRPYASLVYLSNSREQIDLVNQVAWKTTLTVGALGLNLVGELQNGVHDVLSGNEAEGWDHQISDGGELTARYVVARQQKIATLFDSMEVKSTVQASVGYLTETSWSLSIRDGSYHSPWSSFNPELASYGEKSTYTTSARPVQEHYFWAGVTVKARAYNAFLQGQFRNSDVTYHRDELRSLIAEAWLGYTFAFHDGYRLSYVLRGQTSEIKAGAGDRNMVWGGLILAKTFN